MKHGVAAAAALTAGWWGWLAPWTAVVAAFALVAFMSVITALWAGAKPEVEALGRDAAAVVLGAVRRLLHLPPR